METIDKRFKTLLGGGLILLASLVATSHAGAQTCVQPPSDLVSWWPGEGNADDIQNGNDGMPQNGATFTTLQSGKVGDAFSFVDDYVDIPDAPNLDFGSGSSITIEAWLKRIEDAPVQHFLGKRPGCATGINYQMLLVNDVLVFGAEAGSGVGGGAIPINQWTHVAGTFDAATTTWRAYVDGVPVGNTNSGGTLGPVNSASLTIGGSGTCPERFNGLIDEVSIYNRALAASEIQAIFNAGSAGKCKAQDVKIAFTTRRDGNFEIYSMNPDGTVPTNLTNNPAVDAFPAWSPDASKIGFTSNRDGNFEIYSMNADGSGVTRLTSTARVDGGLAWSPSETKIAFTSFRDGNFEIYSMNTDGTGLVNLTNNRKGDLKPTWSPDGTKIAFTSNRERGNFDIYVMNADGSGQTRLTSDTAVDIVPAWSPEPDASKIAFASNRDGNFEVYVMNPDGSGQMRLTTSAAADLEPAWSKDGARIAFTSNRDGNLEIYSMKADGSEQTKLTTNPAADSSPDW